jgi:hypothetical protein
LNFAANFRLFFLAYCAYPFNEEKDAIIIFTKPIEVINMIFNELENHKKEKEVDYDLFYKLAPLSNESCSYNAMIEYRTIRKLKS